MSTVRSILHSIPVDDDTVIKLIFLDPDSRQKIYITSFSDSQLQYYCYRYSVIRYSHNLKYNVVKLYVIKRFQ